MKALSEANQKRAKQFQFCVEKIRKLISNQIRNKYQAWMIEKRATMRDNQSERLAKAVSKGIWGYILDAEMEPIEKQDLGYYEKGEADFKVKWTAAGRATLTLWREQILKVLNGQATCQLEWSSHAS